MLATWYSGPAKLCRVRVGGREGEGGGGGSHVGSVAVGDSMVSQIIWVWGTNWMVGPGRPAAFTSDLPLPAPTLLSTVMRVRQMPEAKRGCRIAPRRPPADPSFLGSS